MPRPDRGAGPGCCAAPPVRMPGTAVTSFRPLARTGRAEPDVQGGEGQLPPRPLSCPGPRTEPSSRRAGRRPRRPPRPAPLPKGGGGTDPGCQSGGRRRTGGAGLGGSVGWWLRGGGRLGGAGRCPALSRVLRGHWRGGRAAWGRDCPGGGVLRRCVRPTGPGRAQTRGGGGGSLERACAGPCPGRGVRPAGAAMEPWALLPVACTACSLAMFATGL